MGKILKGSDSDKLEVHSLSTFSSVEKGTKQFSVQTFSSVDLGTSAFDYKDLEKQAEKVESPNIEEPLQPEEEPVEEVDPTIITIEKHEEVVLSEKETAKKLGYDEGFQKGFDEAKAQYNKAYDIERNDYLNSITSQMQGAVSELQQIKAAVNAFDEELPALVLGFVKEIIGVERKINDDIVASVIKESLFRIRGMEDVTLVINPADEDIVKEKCPGYPFELESAVVSGGFKVKTRIGEIDFGIETMIDRLEESINEKLTTSEDN